MDWVQNVAEFECAQEKFIASESQKGKFGTKKGTGSAEVPLIRIYIVELERFRIIEDDDSTGAEKDKYG